MYKCKSKNRFFCLLAVLMCGIMLSGIFALQASAAVGYEGKGSKSSPYLVKTAEQLDGIRNNLSAHYKLANTVDLSGYDNFEPVGRLDNPFTGTFVCDTNEDGTAKYAIKNLKIYNDAGEKNGHVENANHYTDYVKNKSKWEAALFGATKGATFENILVMDVNITNTVLGQSQMNPDYSTNPGQDEMATAALIGIANKTKITGCGATGTINSKSNHTGGLIGAINNGSTLKNSFSYINITNTGWWNTGGILATAYDEKSKVEGCYYSGNVKGGAYNVGALVGSAKASVKNSCAEGTVGPSTATSFIGTSYATTVSPKDICENTYTLAKIVGRTNAQTNKKVANNNYITDEAGGLQVGFAAASRDEIISIFGALGGWRIGANGMPIPKGCYPVSDSSKYIPLAVTEQPAVSETVSSNESAAVSESEQAVTSENEAQAENETETETETVIEDIEYEMSTAELVLIIVLASLTVIMIGVGAFVIVLILKQKKKIVEDDEIDG